MSKLFCKHCNKQVDFEIIVKANNHVAHCWECGHYIKNIPHSTAESVFYFGKYNGTKVSECQDLQYLEWVVKNVKLKEKMKEDIYQRIQTLEYNFK